MMKEFKDTKNTGPEKAQRIYETALELMEKGVVMKKLTGVPQTPIKNKELKELSECAVLFDKAHTQLVLGDKPFCDQFYLVDNYGMNANDMAIMVIKFGSGQALTDKETRLAKDLGFPV